MPKPERIEIIGTELALRWGDGDETFLPHAFLRQHSPSASNKGERDIFGTQYGGSEQSEFPDVRVSGWQAVGNYAIRIEFSDGHNTGIYRWDYLRKLAELQNP